MVGRTLIDGGMVAKGRQKAIEMLNRVIQFIEYSHELMMKNQIIVTKVTRDRNSANSFLMGFELFKEDLEIKIKVYKEDLGKFLISTRNAISSFKPQGLRALAVSTSEELKQ